LVATVSLDLRIAGIFRGLRAGYTFHPDEPKQVQALSRYLRGEYLWYTGTWFYDGYPYGLNHVDEWLLRGALPPATGIHRHSTPEWRAPAEVARRDLRFLARGLRVGYGLAVVVLAAAAAAALGMGRRGMGIVAALCALAPVSIAVCHMATGDVGVDLFGTLALLLLALHARGARTALLGLAAMAVGAAFSCKYNGALAAIPVGLYLLLRAWRDRSPMRFAGAVLLCSACAVAAFVLTTPALWIQPTRTLEDIAINLDRIRWYRVDADWWASLSFLRRLGVAGSNLPRSWTALGWPLVAAALWGCAVAARDWSGVRAAGSHPAVSSRQQARLAVCVYPFLAMAVSILGKPVVQPFHFSYLVAPFALAAGIGILSLLDGPGGIRRALGAAVVALLLASGAHAACRERFFWSKDDIGLFANFRSLVLEPYDDRRAGGDVIKQFYLEPESSAVFRNQPGRITPADPVAWTGIPVIPLPWISFPLRSDWIFLNGVVFPRNDRSFRVNGGQTEKRWLVFSGREHPVTLGLRTGAWPVELRLSAGDTVQRLMLGPDAQTTVEIAPRASRLSRGEKEYGAVSLCPLRVSASGGDAWLTVMSSAAERDLFALSGPAAGAMTPPADLWNEVSPASLVQFSRLRFYQGEQPVVLDAAQAEAAAFILSETGCLPLAENHRQEVQAGELVADRLFIDSRRGCLALPAGAYELRCRMVGLTGADRLELSLEDPYALGGFDPARLEQKLVPGEQIVSLRFSKPFAPHQCRVVVRCREGRAVLLGWKLAPDAGRIRQELETWAVQGNAPAWARSRDGAGIEDLHRQDAGVRLGGSIHLVELAFAESVQAGGELRVWLNSRVERLRMPAFRNYDVFVHVNDEHDRQILAGEISLAEAMARGAVGQASRIPVPAGIPEGTYDVRMGVVHRLTGKRLEIEAPPGGGLSHRRRSLLVGRVAVNPPGPVAGGAYVIPVPEPR